MKGDAAGWIVTGIVVAAIWTLLLIFLTKPNAETPDNRKLVTVEQDYWIQGADTQSNVKCYKGVAIVTEYGYNTTKVLGQSVVADSTLCEAK